MTVKRLIKELNEWDDLAEVTVFSDSSIAIWPKWATKPEHEIYLDEEEENDDVY